MNSISELFAGAMAVSRAALPTAQRQALEADQAKGDSQFEFYYSQLVVERSVTKTTTMAENGRDESALLRQKLKQMEEQLFAMILSMANRDEVGCCRGNAGVDPKHDPLAGLDASQVEETVRVRLEEQMVAVDIAEQVRAGRHPEDVEQKKSRLGSMDWLWTG